MNINEMHSEQQHRRDTLFVDNVRSSSDLDGCLAATLEILHQQIHRALPPRIVLLWKKWIYALMQHFENKLTALTQTQRQIRDHSPSPRPEVVPLSMISAGTAESAESITFCKPRVVVKYKKKRNKTRSQSQSLRKS